MTYRASIRTLRVATLRSITLHSVALLLGTFSLAGLANAQVVSYSENITFPADSGALNVKLPPYNAVGDGVADDTAAINAAIRDSGTADLGVYWWQDKIVYLPNGTYKVSGTLLKKFTSGSNSGGFASGLILVGQSQTGTRIQLADNTPGFGASDAITPVVRTTSKGANSAINNSPTGSGSDAYRNSIENLTIDVGHGNPHANAVAYLANNVGSIRNVTLSAPLSSGNIGLDLTNLNVGPALIQNVTITGFNYAIDAVGTEYGVTFDHLSLTGQISGAVRNSGNLLSMNYLSTNSAGPAITNNDANGMVVLYNSTLQHGGTAPVLIQNTGSIVFHKTVVSNSQSFTGNTISPVEGHLVGTTWTPVTLPWDIPADDTPVTSYDDVSLWHSVGASNNDYTSTSGGVPSIVDQFDAIQAALNSGSSTIYLPHGIFYIYKNLNVPHTVKRIVGMDSTLRIDWSSPQINFDLTEGMLHVSEGDTSPLIIERMAFDNYISGKGTPYAIDHNVARTVVLRDVVTNAANQVTRLVAGGELFMEDTCCGALRLAGPAVVRARQLDAETKGYGNIRVINTSAPLWVLGMKTEAPVNVIDGGVDSATQIVGGLFYTSPGIKYPVQSATTCAAALTPTASAPTPPNKPSSTPAAFILTNASLQATFVEEVLTQTQPLQDPADSRYPWYIADKENGTELPCTSNSVGIPRTGLQQPSNLQENGFNVPYVSAGPASPPNIPQ